MKKFKTESGITLVALIITIIILILLAAISISGLFKAKIINTATDAAIKYEQEQQKEIDMLKDLDEYIEYDLSGKKFKVELSPKKVTAYKMEVTAKVTRAKAGVESYRFDYKLSTDTDWIQGEEIKTEEEEYNYTYENLTNGVEYQLRAVVKDKEGDEETSQVLIYSTIEGELLEPSIIVVGSKNEGYEAQEYYSDEVTVTVIDKGEVDTTRANKIKYEVTGAEEKGETVEIPEERQITFKVSTDGTSYIKAYTIDNRGIQIGATEPKIIKIDKEGPKEAKLEYQSKTKDTITVKASGKDDISGIKEYTYQYKESAESEANWKTVDTKGETSYTYPNTVIQQSKSYDLRVIITDNAGNKTASQKITEVTNTAPVFAYEPIGKAVTETNDKMTIEVMATDTDVDDILTYTLWWGTSETNLSKTNLTQEARQGSTVTFTQTGLSNDTRYYFKVSVNDSMCEDVLSSSSNQRTWCKGSYCSGGSYSYPTCTSCNGNKTVNCSTCRGNKTVTCTSCNGSRQGDTCIKNLYQMCRSRFCHLRMHTDT